MRPLILVGVFVLLLAGPAASQAPPSRPAGEELLDLLAATRVEDARDRLGDLPEGEPWSAAARAAWAWHRGDYAAVGEHLAEVPETGRTAERISWLRLALPGAQEATSSMEERQVGHFVFRWAPGVDELLVEYAGEALEGQRRVLADLLRVEPQEPTIVEFFPSVAPFVAASGLPMEWVETTGTVAIAKWDRMLVLSPMNMSRGYPWMDTLAHEYTHLALSRASRNRSPIWFQEGTAKVLESAWRGGGRSTWLDPQSETLLAEALREDRLIPFASMHPSMAALPSSRDAAQAFAQVAFAVSWLLDEAGDEGFRRIVQAAALHGDLMRAIDQVLGPMGGAFESKVLRHMRATTFRVRAPLQHFDRELKEHSASTRDDEAISLDPILQADRDMQDRTRVGDLLRLRGHNEAAVLEYRRAEGVSELHSPALANKLARSLRSLGRVEEAMTQLQGSVSLQPEYTPTVSLLAELLGQAGDPEAARLMSLRAIALNPFDPQVHRGLLAACAELADEPCRAREQRALQTLGADTH